MLTCPSCHNETNSIHTTENSLVVCSVCGSTCDICEEWFSKEDLHFNEDNSVVCFSCLPTWPGTVDENI